MAIDQREALIAAVRAQVEKEKAAKAAKNKKEQENAQLSGKAVTTNKSEDGKPKYKTLSAEDLAKIEEKKRKKHAAELGIELEEETPAAEAEPEAVEAESKEESKADAAPKKEEAVKAEEKKNAADKAEESSLGMSVGIQPDKSGKTLGGVGTGGLGGAKADSTEGSAKSSGGLGLKLNTGSDGAEAKSSTGKLKIAGADETAKKEEAKPKAEEAPKLKMTGSTAAPSKDDSYLREQKARLQPTKLTGGDGSVTVIADDSEKDDTTTFVKDGDTTVISNGTNWQTAEAPKSGVKNGEDEINIVPNRKTATNDVKSMYDIDNDDDDALGAELSKFANYGDEAAKKEDPAAKAAEEARKKAEAEAARKAEEEAKKKAEEEARKKAKLEEAERKAAERERRIAEAAAKQRAEEEARKRAEKDAAMKEAEEARKKAAEEARKKAAEEARKKAEEEARAKAKDKALKAAEEARKKAEEAAKILEEAKKAEEEAAKQAEESRKRIEEEAKKKAEEEAKRKAEEEAKKKAEEEAKRKAEEEAKRKAEEEAKRKAEAEAKKKAEAEAKKKAEEEAKKAAEAARKKAEEAMKILEAAKKAEEEALKAAEEARKQAEENARKAAEEEAKRAEEEAKRKAEEEAKKAAEAEEAKRKADEEAKRKADEEAKRKADEEARKKLEEETKKAEEAARKKAEEAAKILEAAKKAEEEALKAAEEADNIKLDLTMPSEDGKLPMAAYYLEKYTKVDSISAPIIDTFNSIANNPKESRNVILKGEHGFGLTSVGEDFARSFYDMAICKAKTIAKIKAAALNKVKLADAMTKLKDGCLVVENAGLIAADRLNELIKLSSPEQNNIVIILTGESGSIDRLMDSAKPENGTFKYSVNMLGISTADMIAIAKGYVSQRGFKSDDIDGTLRSLLMAMESGNIDRMLKTVDDALLKCEDREKQKGISKKYLLAEDFK
ncbi:MAG: hypothetical protein NC240_11335 [Clostridium sp.]|nr:hypothetical protein [Clostridium sp.]